MDLSKQVVSLEQAKRLKELGIDGPVMFWHTQEKTPTNPNLHYYGWKQENMPWDIFYSKRSQISTSRVFEEYPAFTVAELGVMLPDGADCFGKHWAQFQTFRVIKGVQPSQQWCCYCDESSPSGVNDQGDDYYKVAKKVYGHTEAEARATMLIYLLENKLTTAEECNKRLTQ